MKYINAVLSLNVLAFVLFLLGQWAYWSGELLQAIYLTVLALFLHTVRKEYV